MPLRLLEIIIPESNNEEEQKEKAKNNAPRISREELHSDIVDSPNPRANLSPHPEIGVRDCGLGGEGEACSEHFCRCPVLY